MDKGLLVVVSGPSGTGKGTICKRLVEDNKDIELSVSATTRNPREGEVEGVNYYFLKVDEFKRRIECNDFLEYASVYENFYGTPKSNVVQKLNEGKSVILEIDIQGAMKVKKQYEDGVFIFVAPPSLKELRNRIVNRGTDSMEVIDKRMMCARSEMECAIEYDYLVVNDDLETAVKSVEAIVASEKKKANRNVDLINKIMA